MPTIAAGTRLYHGTRKGGYAWWKGGHPFPNHDGEDGGVSFTLDYLSTPKTRADPSIIILVYEAATTLQVEHCSSKGLFYSKLQQNSEGVFYADHEQEVVMKAVNAPRYLRFVGGLKED